jgi:hypothetical protein
LAFLRTSLWPSVLVLGVGSNAGCRIIECVPRDPSASTIATLSVTPGPVLSVRGRVLNIETGGPLSSARARVTSNGQWEDVDSDGRVELPIPGPGTYTIEVAAPGYDVGSRVVAVRVDAGVAWIAAMARSGALVRDRACGADTAIGSTP